MSTEPFELRAVTHPTASEYNWRPVWNAKEDDTRTAGWMTSQAWEIHMPSEVFVRDGLPIGRALVVVRGEPAEVLVVLQWREQMHIVDAQGVKQALASMCGVTNVVVR